VLDFGLACVIRTTNTRRLITIDLWEISLVTFPMLDGARVSAVKSRARQQAEALFAAH
jgi:uncharacterized protein